AKMRSFSTQTVVVVGITAVVLPAVFRIISSPLALLLISPLILTSLAITFLVLQVLVGHLLDTKTSRKRLALVDAARPFLFSTPPAWQAVLTRSQWSQTGPLAPLCPDLPEVSAAINDIISLIIRDFVLIWYKELSTSTAFPTAVSVLVHSCLKKLSD